MSFREGCAGPNRLHLKANDGKANDGKAYRPPSLPLGLGCYPTLYSGNTLVWCLSFRFSYSIASDPGGSRPKVPLAFYFHVTKWAS